MSRPDLQATLGLNAKPFTDALDAVGRNATAGMMGVGRRMGRQMVSGLLAVVGFQFIRRMANETVRWAKDTAGVRQEYEKMGIVVTDEFVGKMVKAGREFNALGAQYRAMMLPVVAGLATGALSFLQSIKEAAAYWKFMYEHNLGSKLDTAADFWTKYYQSQMENLPSWDSSKGFRRNIMTQMAAYSRGGHLSRAQKAWREASSYVAEHSAGPSMSMSDAHAQAGAIALDMRERWREMMDAIVNMSIADPTAFRRGGGGGGGRLASIGGDVGGLNDRVLQIEREQVRLLKAIETNTKPKAGAGTLEISGT